MKQLQASFLELGKPAGKAAGAALVKDQFLGLFSGAVADGHFVIGVRGAASAAVAGAEIERLRRAIAGAPSDLLRRAVPAGAAEKDTGTKPAAGAESRAPEAPEVKEQ